MPVTARQLDVLQAIQTLSRELGWRPSIREIADHLGLSSPEATHRHLTVLEQHGLIVRQPLSPRALRLTPTGHQALRDSRAA